MSRSEAAAPRILLGVSGAIAAYKAADVVRGLRRAGAEVTVALTANAEHFVTPFLLANLCGRPAITGQYRPEMSDVHHVNLALETDLLLVAPATADLLARMAVGIADDFLTTFYLATAAPVLLAPAMNTRMWEHPATRANVATLRQRGALLFGPVAGELATLHSGMGRMAEPEAIVEEALRVLAGGGSLRGEVLLVTAGPTAEDLDPARTLSNRSTGKMGYALAAAARARGAEVVLVSGPTALAPPAGVELVSVRSAEQMRTAALGVLPRASVVLMTAAVADFRPLRTETTKLSKEGNERLTLELVRTPDILAEIGRAKEGRYVVGFAAEDRDLEARALDKLRRKSLDLIVANDIAEPGIGFGSEDNAVLLLSADGERESLGKRPKREIANAILDRVERALARRRA